MADQLLDPFSLVYDALWVMVERNDKLAKFIAKGNRIKFDEDSDVDPAITDADTPNLMLLSGGGTFGEQDNSSQRSVTRIYTWVLTTGDFRLNPVFNAISWELYRSMIDYACVLCSLQWCNCNFIQNCRIVSADDGTLAQTLQENVPGWSTIWSIEVDMLFNYELLKIK